MARPHGSPTQPQAGDGSPLYATDVSHTSTVPLLDALIGYEQKGVGVDMALKSILGIFRLCKLYSEEPADKAKYAAVVDAIIETRMLANFGRPIFTLRHGCGTFAAKNKFHFWYWLFLTLSFFLRVPEQLSGDLNYLQKTVFHRWSRKRLSFYYRFFKSLSLTCCVLSELCRRRTLQDCIAKATTVDSREKAELDMRVSNVLIVRTLCDMYVYFKWIPSYTPIKTLEYVCGSVSGVLGVWLVWKDTRYVRPPAEEVRKAAHDPSTLTRPNSMLMRGCRESELGSGGSGDE